MHHSTFRKFTLLFGLVALVAVVGGCKKKVAATPPAPPPAPALQPTVTLNASPSTINAGQTVTLSWSSTNATDLDIQPGSEKSRRKARLRRIRRSPQRTRSLQRARAAAPLPVLASA